MPRPLSPPTLRHYIQRIVSNYGNAQLAISANQKGAIVGTLSDEWPNDHDRRICLNYLFSEDASKVHELSSKQLTDAQWCALKRWIGAVRYDDNSPWEPNVHFYTEAEWLLWEVSKLEREALKEAGQMEFPYVDPTLDDDNHE